MAVAGSLFVLLVLIEVCCCMMAPKSPKAPDSDDEEDGIEFATLPRNAAGMDLPPPDELPDAQFQSFDPRLQEPPASGAANQNPYAAPPPNAVTGQNPYAAP